MGNYLKDFVLVVLCVALPAVASVQISLEFQPKSDYADSNLIWLNKTNYDYWSEKLDNYLEIYRNAELTEGRENNSVDCNYNNFPDEDKVCKIDVEKFEPCVASNYFGYKRGKPCVFVELQAIKDWKPDYWNNTKSLPKAMPADVRSYVEYLVTDHNMWQTLWLTCEGELPADKENIGVVKYAPFPGYPGYSFPFTGQQGYLNPIVGVHFLGVRTGIIVSIVCKVWAPGVIHNYQKEVGMVKFEILSDV